MAVCAFVLITAVNGDKSQVKQPVDSLRKVTNLLNVMAQFMNFYKVWMSTISPVFILKEQLCLVLES